MEWVAFQQQIGNRIHFQSSDMDEPDSLFYDDFYKFIIKEVPDIQNRHLFIEAIERFSKILLFSNGNWEVHLDQIAPATHRELVEINSDEKERRSIFDMMQNRAQKLYQNTAKRTRFHPKFF